MPINPQIAPRPESGPLDYLPVASMRGPDDTRRGAIGKALLVWLLSGSFGLAVLAFIIFAMVGC